MNGGHCCIISMRKPWRDKWKTQIFISYVHVESTWLWMMLGLVGQSIVQTVVRRLRFPFPMFAGNARVDQSCWHPIISPEKQLNVMNVKQNTKFLLQISP
jgi:hypothetical protein